MEKARCGQASQFLKKGKKKQVRDELDRLKQAEKKKRRLEKALANSAAIRSELEKKKQKKIEEQLRLDAEGAATAEAAALHVLLGEDSDRSCQLMLNNNKKYTTLDYSSSDPFVSSESFVNSSVDRLGWVTNAYGPAWKWNRLGISQPLPPYLHVNDLQVPYIGTTDGTDNSPGFIAAQAFSPGFIAAQAFSSLRIVEDSHDARFAGHGAATVVFNRILEGCNMGNEIDLYREL